MEISEGFLNLFGSTFIGDKEASEKLEKAVKFEDLSLQQMSASDFFLIGCQLQKLNSDLEVKRGKSWKEVDLYNEGMNIQSFLINRLKRYRVTSALYFT